MPLRMQRCSVAGCCVRVREVMREEGCSLHAPTTVLPLSAGCLTTCFKACLSGHYTMQQQRNTSRTEIVEQDGSDASTTGVLRPVSGPAGNHSPGRRPPSATRAALQAARLGTPAPARRGPPSRRAGSGTTQAPPARRGRHAATPGRGSSRPGPPVHVQMLVRRRTVILLLSACHQHAGGHTPVLQ